MTATRSLDCGIQNRRDAKDERLVLVMLEIPNNDAYSEFKFTIARELLELKDNE